MYSCVPRNFFSLIIFPNLVKVIYSLREKWVENLTWAPYKIRTLWKTCWKGSLLVPRSKSVEKIIIPNISSSLVSDGSRRAKDFGLGLISAAQISPCVMYL